MTFGLLIENDSGGLVVDSEAMGLHYLGQAAFLENTTVVNNTFVLNRTKRRYSITLSSASAVPVAAIKLQTDRWHSIQGIRRASAGSSTWYIDTYSADSSMLALVSANMTQSASAEVHVFATGETSGETYGLRLLNAFGAVSWDFGRKPLFVRQVAQFETRTDRATYRDGDAIAAPGIAQPMVINCCAHGKDNMRIGTIGTHEDSEYVFQLGADGSVKRVLLGTFRERGETGGSPYSPQPDWAMPSATVFVLDAQSYA